MQNLTATRQGNENEQTLKVNIKLNVNTGTAREVDL